MKTLYHTYKYVDWCILIGYRVDVSGVWRHVNYH